MGTTLNGCESGTSGNIKLRMGGKIMANPRLMDLVQNHLWNFYYVDPSPTSMNLGENFVMDYELGDVPFSDTPTYEYRDRRKVIDEIGSDVCMMALPSGWKGIGDYNFDLVDDILNQLLKDYPHRYFIPRVHMGPPRDWMRAHPEELMVYWKGPTDPEEIRAMVGTSYQDAVGADGGAKPYPDQRISMQSISSPIWLHDALEAWEKLIRHLEESPYADRIIGYVPQFGNHGECVWWGAWRDQGDGRRGDFGIHHRTLFFDWALEKYNSLEALRDAWHIPDLTRENCSVTTPPERWSWGGKKLRDVLLADDQRQVDCNEFHCKCCFDAIEAFGKRAKEVSGKLVGAIYGYLQAETVGYDGHAAIDRAINSPYIDFCGSPKGYHYCMAGEPGSSQGPAQSFCRKMMWIEENDCRSHHAMALDPARSPANLEETITCFWREMYRALTFGHGFWWTNLLGYRDDWFTDEGLIAMFKEQTKFYKKWAPKPRKSVTEVLFVEDEQSYVHMTQLSGMQRGLRLRLERELRLSGVPVDHYRVNDMLEMDLSQYKMIVFTHAFVMPQETWKKIEQRIRPDACIIWNYAAGMMDPQYNPENQKLVTGFYTAECPDRQQPEEVYHHIHWHCDRTQVFDYPLLEILPEAGQEILQTSPEGKILTARVPRKQGSSVLAVECTLRPPLLRKLMADAGIRFLAPEQCSVLADEKLIGFFPRKDVKFCFEFDGQWRNVITGELVQGEKELEIASKDFAVFEKAGE